MGIVSSIIRSSDDVLKPKKKSYWGYDLEVRLLNAKRVTSKTFLLPAEKREIRHELSGKEPVERIIILDNSNRKLGRLTTKEVKDILDDMGFNVDVLVSGKHFSDFDAVMNIGGYSVPGYGWFMRMLAGIFPRREKLLLSKLSPGRSRLHVRVFEQNDGSWAMVAHTDINWLRLNPSLVYRAHLIEGKGDYSTGTAIMFNLLNEFSKSLEENKVFKQEDIDGVIKNSYGKSEV